MAGQSGSKRTQRLTLKGRLNISNAQEINKKIRNFCEKSERGKIFLNKVEEVDLSFIQILYSLVRGNGKPGNSNVSVSVDNPELIHKSVVEAGLDSFFKIVPDNSGKRFIIEGAADE